MKRKRSETPNVSEYLTTGEVSDLLAGMISQSTTTRLFDRGELGGRVNPLTGKREIEWGSVIKLLKEKGLSEDKIAPVEKRRGEEWTHPRRKGKGKES